MEDDWQRKIASDLKGFVDARNLQNFYGSLKQVFGPTSHSLSAVRSKDGTVLHRDKQQIMSRLQEHYFELLNTRNHYDPAVLDTIPDKPIVHDIDTPTSIEKVNCAIRRLKNNKSPGVDGLLGEVLKHGEEALHLRLHQMIYMQDVGGRACTTTMERRKLNFHIQA